MKCVIPGPNVKGFGRAIHALSRIGEDLYLEFSNEGLTMKTINSSRSAYGSISFKREFFISYSEISSQASNSTTANSDDSRKCKLPIKSLASVFKSAGHMEKQVDTCSLTLSPSTPNLTVEFKCKHSIIKHHRLHLIDTELMAAIYSKESCTQHIEAEAKVLTDAVLNFTSTQEEITLAVTADHTFFRNYADDTQDATKVAHTALSLSKQEFDLYDINCDTEITFCLKELRAILFFTEASQLPVTLHFAEPGKPLIICTDNPPVLEATFVLATIKETNNKRPSSRVTGSSNTSKQTVNPPNSISAPRTLMESALPQSTPSVALQCSSSSMTRAVPTRGATLNATASTSEEHFANVPDMSVAPVAEMANEEEEETVPGTPPAKKARILFQRCFETTLIENPPRPSQILEADTSDTEETAVLNPRKLIVT